MRDGKGGKDRMVPIPDHAADSLETWLAKRAGIEKRVSPHTLRHPAAVAALAEDDLILVALGPHPNRLKQTALADRRPQARAGRGPGVPLVHPYRCPNPDL